jgi:hypothetical protein
MFDDGGTGGGICLFFFKENLIKLNQHGKLLYLPISTTNNVISCWCHIMIIICWKGA